MARARRTGPGEKVDCVAREGSSCAVPCVQHANSSVTAAPSACLCPLEMAPAGWDEDRGVRVERVSVGHSCHVVGDRALGPVALRDPLMLGRQQLGMALEMAEELPEHALRLAVLGLRRAGKVDV